jgi:ubiquitin-like-conjugating enzyme ATG3
MCYDLREKGDASKARNYLPADKQYLVTRGVPCLRRATSLAYTDADEDAERLVSMRDAAGGADGDEWVETHAGRAPGGGSGAPGTIDDIPDLDADEPHESVTRAMGSLSVGGAPTAGGGGEGAPAVADIPDLDEIPDMEEDLEIVEDEAAAEPAQANVKDIAYAGISHAQPARTDMHTVSSSRQRAICCKCEHTT